MVFLYRGKRVNRVRIPQKLDVNNIQIGVPVLNDEAQKVGLSEVGEVILPSGTFGPQSERNAYGYSYADKTKPKLHRYVSTIWIHPYGQIDRSMVSADISRKCYPVVKVEPLGMELLLYKNVKGDKYVIVDMNSEIRNKHIKDAINLMLEIYGCCYVFDQEIDLDKIVRIRKCNWVILPPGECPSDHVKKMLREQGKSTDTYDTYRLEYIEKHKPEACNVGLNGFRGYYAYIFKGYCVLETAYYGNATYVIPKENWEKLSQKTKKELLDEKKVIARIEHRAAWKNMINMYLDAE